MIGKRKKPENSGPLSGLGRDFLAGLMFLTCLPIPGRQPGPLSASGFWSFPVIGAVIGFVGGGTYGLAVWANLGEGLAALLAVAVTVILTGALHEDGLADAADGLWGGHAPERRLTIMRDSRMGVFGGVALFSSLGLRGVALASLSDPLPVLLIWMAAHGLSRGLMVGVMAPFAPVAQKGLAAKAGRPSSMMAGVALILGLTISMGCLNFVLGWFWAAAASVVCLAGGGALMLVAWRKLGGYNGDVLGAVQQGGETALLLACVALSKQLGAE